MDRTTAVSAAAGLAAGLVLGFALGMRHRPPPAPPTPQEEVALWQQIGFSEDAARVLVTRSRAGMLPSQVRAELSAGQAAADPAAVPVPGERRRADCARLAAEGSVSPGAWERALLEAGEPWAGVALAVQAETDAARRLDGLLAGFRALCPAEPPPR